jgi:hypothetical protein
VKKSPLYILLLLIFTFSCSESDRELGDGYYYLPKYEAIDVGYPEAIVYKSSQEYVFNDVKIRGDVKEIKANSKFIIAKRDPLISRDRNTGVLEYYIILKSNDSLIGPLTSEKFKQTTKSLGVNLEFK